MMNELSIITGKFVSSRTQERFDLGVGKLESVSQRMCVFFCFFFFFFFLDENYGTITDVPRDVRRHFSLSRTWSFV